MHMLAASAKTDRGLCREENEDAFALFDAGPYRFVLVCDGCGGHQGGATASRLAVETAQAYLSSVCANVPFEVAQDELETAIRMANEAVFRAALQSPECGDMGTTFVGAVVDERTLKASVIHVGDSRAYVLHGDGLFQVTRYQTLVQGLVDGGAIAQEEADSHPYSNVLSACLGSGPELSPLRSLEHFHLEMGDRLMLCSDGLHGYVSHERIATRLQGLSADEAVDMLVQDANDEGGKDNITVALLSVGELPAMSAEAAWRWLSASGQWRSVGGGTHGGLPNQNPEPPMREEGPRGASEPVARAGVRAWLSNTLGKLSPFPSNSGADEA